MSNAVSVVNGASFDGAVQVKDAGLVGMVTLRGDFASAKLGKAVNAAVGLALPEARGIKTGTKGGVAWMSPDELLLFCDYSDADALVAKLDKALAGEHFLAVNVSDARASFRLTGAGVREVIAKGSPADLSPEALKIGEMRRSRLGQVAVAFWLSDAETLELVCFRSVGRFVYDWLCVAAAKDTLPAHF
nr:sarcosine oxidase subunit gamma family protein [Amylibacter sp.]